MRQASKATPGAHRWNWPWLVIAAAMTIVIAFAAATMPWRDTLSTIATASPAWLALAVAANILMFPLWAMQWRLLASGPQPKPLRPYFETTAIYAATKSVLPMTGPASAFALLVTVVKLSPGAALAVIALDQLATGITKLAFLMWAILLLPLPAWVQTGAVALLVLVSAAAVAMAILAHGQAPLHRVASRLPDLIGRLLKPIVAWGSHLELLRDRSRAWYAMLLAVAKKLLEVASVLAIQKACGLPLMFDAAILIVAALSIATALPAVPAHLGVYEATVVIVYQTLGVPPATALAAAILQHAAVLLVSIGIGSAMVLVRHMGSTASLRP